MKLSILLFTLLTTSFCFSQTKNDSIKVNVTFIIELDGKISNIKVKDIQCENCKQKNKRKIKEEAIRIFKKIYDFDPPKKRQEYLLPIKFVLND